MNQLQKIEITDAQQFMFYEYENCIVLNGWEYISVIEKQEDGFCRLAFTVSRMKEVNDSNYQKGVATLRTARDIRFNSHALYRLSEKQHKSIHIPICHHAISRPLKFFRVYAILNMKMKLFQRSDFDEA